MLPRELPERLPGHALDDHRRQRVPHVAVEVPIAGREIQIPLPAGEAENVVVGNDVVHPPAGERQQAPLIAQAARVQQQVSDGNRLAEVVHLGQMLADVIVERQLAVLLQQQNGKRRELLRDRRDVKNGVGLDRAALLEIGHAVGLLVNQFPVAHDADRTARRRRLVPAGEQLVHLVGQFVRPTRRGAEKQQRGNKQQAIHGRHLGRMRKAKMYHESQIKGISLNDCGSEAAKQDFD